MFWLNCFRLCPRGHRKKKKNCKLRRNKSRAHTAHHTPTLNTFYTFVDTLSTLMLSVHYCTFHLWFFYDLTLMLCSNCYRLRPSTYHSETRHRTKNLATIFVNIQCLLSALFLAWQAAALPLTSKLARSKLCRTLGGGEGGNRPSVRMLRISCSLQLEHEDTKLVCKPQFCWTAGQTISNPSSVHVLITLSLSGFLIF